MLKITIRGNIKEVDDKLYLAYADGNEFKVSSSGEYPLGDFLWEVVPSIDPQGVDEEAYEGIFSEPIGQLMLENQRLNLVAFHKLEEVILEWIPSVNINK